MNGQRRPPGGAVTAHMMEFLQGSLTQLRPVELDEFEILGLLLDGRSPADIELTRIALRLGLI